MKKRAVLSLSGGMDSTCLLIKLLAENYSEIQCVGFNYGQRHKVELQKAQQNIDLLKSLGFEVSYNIVDLTSLTSSLESSLTFSKEVPEGHYEDECMKDTVVPNRNKIFSSIIQAIALSTAKRSGGNVVIAMGIHNGDNAVYPDCRPEFREADLKAFQIGNWDSELVDCYTPYLSTDKAGILKECIIHCDFLGIDFDKILKNTSTTYSPTWDGKSEGRTSSDIERIEAFIKIGRVDPAEYTLTWEEVKKHALKVLNER